MSDPILPPEAEALDQYFNRQPAAPLPPDEAALAEALMAAALVEPDPAFAAALEKQLATKAQPRPQTTRAAAFNPFLWSNSMRKFSAFAVTTVLIVGLLAAGVWLSTRVQPGLPNPEVSVTEAATEPSQATDTAQPSPTPEPTATPSLELVPGLVFPDGPDQVTLYRQLPMEALTVENAKQLAAQLGVNGHVYQHEGEGGPSQVIYEVTDGTGNVRFLGSPNYFNLTPDEYNSFVITGQSLPFEQRAAIAEAFLKSAGLLDFDYIFEPSAMSNYGVTVTRLLDGHRLIFDQTLDQNNSVTISAEGKVQSVIRYMPNFEALGLYPIISAEQAWEALNTAATGRGMSTNSSFTMLDASYRIWTPQYLPGESVNLYGYPVAFQAVEPGLPPMININNLKILENTAALAAAIVPGQFMHVWGIYQPTGLQLLGWEVATQADDLLHGTFERLGDTDAANLVVGDQRYSLNYVLADIPNGAEVEVRGVKAGDGEFVWSTMNTPTEGGGGGGGGGGPFPEVVLTPVADLPTSTPYPFPYKTGDTIDGVEGNVEVRYVKQADGSRVTEVRLWLPDPTLGVWPMLLQGEAVNDIAQYNKLPVRVYGTVTAPNPEGVTVAVDRYEVVYPGLQVQAWRGTQSIETIEGRKVLLFIAEDGTRYVSKTSLSMPEENVGEAGVVGHLGDSVIVVGVSKPDETVGGYPVVQELSIGLTTGSDDLAAMAADEAKPSEMDATVSGNDSFLDPNSSYVFEKVELAYLASDFTHGWPPPPDDCSCRIVQPVWRFSGHTQDGQAFWIVVQALTEAYLKPVQ